MPLFQLQIMASNPWCSLLVDAPHLRSLPPSSHGVSVSPHGQSSYKDIIHTGLGPILFQHDCVLTKYICNDPISK